MALGLRNRLAGPGSSSIGSVEGNRKRGVHADGVFVGHYAPGMNSIKLQLWLAPFPIFLLGPPPLLLSLFIQPFTKGSPQQVDSRSVKT